MKYHINGPAYVGAPLVWEIVAEGETKATVVCYDEKLAKRIQECLESDGG